MKIICAWCGSTIQVRCDHCAAPLIEANVIGGTFLAFGESMVCLNGEAPLIYPLRAIDEMKVSHGLCQQCADLTEDERDVLISKRREANKPNPRKPAARKNRPGNQRRNGARSRDAPASAERKTQRCSKSITTTAGSAKRERRTK